jgi:GT2 family glycosyltransferase
MSTVDVSILIVNWNSCEYLKKCVESIVGNTHGVSYEVIVVDSASFDGADSMLAGEFPQVRFIQSTVNLGFAKGSNVAFQASVGEVLLFLNPDTEVAGPAIEAMFAALTSLPGAGAVGCKLLNSDGSVQTSCVQAIPTVLNQTLDSEYLREKWPASSLWGMKALRADPSVPHEVEAISGACLMMRRSVFESVGGFSEDYFMYAEDIDLAQKVRAAGYRNFFVGNGSMVHHGGSSSQQAPSTFSVVMTREAIWRFLRKSRGSVYAFLYRMSMGLSALGRVLLLGVASILRRKNDATALSYRKWVAVLRWSLNCDRIVKQYYGPSVDASSAATS